MTDQPNIQQRIADVLQRHFFWWANHSSIGPNAHCQCGERPRYWSDWTDHVAEVLASELELTQIYAPVVVDDDDYTWPNWNEWYDDRRQAEKAVADDPGTVVGTGYLTAWQAV